MEAIDDPQLLAFGAHGRQRDLLAAVEDHHTTIAAAGRRFGKTKAAAAAALWNLLLVPALDELVAKGEKRYAASVANNAAQARLFVDHAR